MKLKYVLKSTQCLEMTDYKDFIEVSSLWEIYPSCMGLKFPEGEQKGVLREKPTQPSLVAREEGRAYFSWHTVSY
jgi:hypothetical protein